MSEFMTSAEWKQYYEANAINQMPIPWELGGALTAGEASAVIRSLQAWQLGETSDGHHLRAAARRYLNDADDPAFLDSVNLFIGEEQRHGELLGQFLDLNGAGRVGRNWGDSIFRAMRYALPNLEIWTTVVIMVETLAVVYYNAIRRATGSLVLQTICRQILRDEVSHLRFQYERLAQMQARRSRIGRRVMLGLQRILFTATAIAVWIGHHRALRAGGYLFRSYWRTAWNRMEYHWSKMADGIGSAQSVSNPTSSSHFASINSE